jgi:hypothetical protein
MQSLSVSIGIACREQHFRKRFPKTVIPQMQNLSFHGEEGLSRCFRNENLGLAKNSSGIPANIIPGVRFLTRVFHVAYSTARVLERGEKGKHVNTGDKSIGGGS